MIGENNNCKIEEHGNHFVNIAMVSHPKHYNTAGKKECWDEMIDIFGPEAVAIFDILSAFKYSYRAGLKEGNSADQDRMKIVNYMNHVEKLREQFPEEVANRLQPNDCYWAMKEILLED